MSAEILAVLMLGVGISTIIFMAAMAGKMHELTKTYKSQLRYDYHQAERDRLKAKQGGVELVED